MTDTKKGSHSSGSKKDHAKSHKKDSHHKGSDSKHASKHDKPHGAERHEKSDAPKISHVSRSAPTQSQDQSPWMIVSIVLGILLIGSLLTGGFSEFPDMSTNSASAQTGEFNLDGAYAKGDESAPVTIIEYSDFECPFCARFYSDTLGQIESNYIETGQVKFVYKHFPLSFHPNAQPAAEASECAGELGDFYGMHDLLFERQSAWADESDPTDTFVGYADELGLNTGEFRTCLEEGRYADKVQEDFREGQAAGVQGTPAFFIDGRLVSGAQPFSVFEEAIEAALAGEAPSQPEPTQPEPAARIEVSRDEVTGYATGNEDAEVIILEWSSYQCPFCGRHHTQTQPLIKENYIETGLVQQFYFDFDFQPKSKIGATAARCAAEQMDYFEYQEALYNNQAEWSGASDSREYFVSYAESFDLDIDAFTECYDSNRYSDEIAADTALGREFGVSGTPSFLIGNFEDGFTRVVGAQPYSAFEQAIDSLLG